MTSGIIVAIVVIVTIGAHLALYRWVKFKIHEGVILQCLRQDRDNGGSGSCQTTVLASQTDINPDRIAAVCRKSALIEADAQTQNYWRAGEVQE